MKLNKCPKCGSTNIKTGAVISPDEGYIGYCTCQDYQNMFIFASTLLFSAVVTSILWSNEIYHLGGN